MSIMKRCFYVAASVFTVIVVLSAVCYYEKTRLHVYVSEQSPDGSKVAKIAWKWSGPEWYAITEGWLIVKNVKSDSTLIKHALLGGDIPSDITREFKGLSWEDDKIILDVRGRRYKGPTVFEVK